MTVIYEVTVPAPQDVDAAVAAYARKRRKEEDRRYRERNRENRREQYRAYRQRNKQPVDIQWDAPPPQAPREPDFRVALDARISRCPGCDQWQFDRRCNRCMTTHMRSTAA